LTGVARGLRRGAAAAIVVSAGQTTERSLEPAAGDADSNGRGDGPPPRIVSAADTLGSSDSITSHETDQLAAGSGLGGALRLLASVIEVPGGVSIKGGRPTQAGVQIGASTLTDPCSASSTSRCPTTRSIRSR